MGYHLVFYPASAVDTALMGICMQGCNDYCSEFNCCLVSQSSKGLGFDNIDDGRNGEHASRVSQSPCSEHELTTFDIGARASTLAHRHH